MKIIKALSLSVFLLTGCASYAGDKFVDSNGNTEASAPTSTVLASTVDTTTTDTSGKSKTDIIKEKLSKDFPTLPANSVVTATSIPGIYQVVVNGSQYVFTDENATYLVKGDIIHTDTKVSLIDEDLAKKRGNIWKELPAKLAFKKVYGKGERKVAVFFDPDCPYCKQLELDMNQADAGKLNLTVYYYMYPLPIHPDAARKADAIYCAKDKVAVFDQWIVDKKNPEVPAKCDSKVADILKFAASKSIGGTPTLVFSDNYVLSSYLPTEQFLDVIATHNPK